MICYKGRGALYGELWYDEEVPADAGVDIVVYRQRKNPIAGARATALLSLVIDLSPPEGAILDQFGKDCRYKIRRAETKDSLRMELVTEPAAGLDEFCDFYDAFARQKAVGSSNRRWLEAACNAGRLLLTSASRDDETLVWHAYLITGNTAWLQYTGSCFRGRDNDYRAVVGRANRWLHWKEMLRLKELGIMRYDWGGLFEDESTPERAGINRFKKEFGGHPVRTYDCIVPATMKGHMWLTLRNAWRNRNPVRSLYCSLKRNPVHTTGSTPG